MINKQITKQTEIIKYKIMYLGINSFIILCLTKKYSFMDFFLELI